MRRRLILLAVAVIVVATIVALVWFQPQKLVIDQEVNEALPGRPAAIAEDTGEKKQSNTKASQSQAEPAIETLGAGRFRALAHPVSGRAKLLELPTAISTCASKTSRSRKGLISAFVSLGQRPRPMPTHSEETSSTSAH